MARRRVGTRLLAGREPVVDMPPVVGIDVDGRDAGRLDGAEELLARHARRLDALLVFLGEETRNPPG